MTPWIPLWRKLLNELRRMAQAGRPENREVVG